MAKKSKSDDVVASQVTAVATVGDNKTDIVSFFLAHASEAVDLAQELGIQRGGGRHFGGDAYRQLQPL